jgi:hypothetical protein
VLVCPGCSDGFSLGVSAGGSGVGRRGQVHTPAQHITVHHPSCLPMMQQPPAAGMQPAKSGAAHNQLRNSTDVLRLALYCIWVCSRTLVAVACPCMTRCIPDMQQAAWSATASTRMRTIISRLQLGNASDMGNVCQMFLAPPDYFWRFLSATVGTHCTSPLQQPCCLPVTVPIAWRLHLVSCTSSQSVPARTCTDSHSALAQT